MDFPTSYYKKLMKEANKSMSYLEDFPYMNQAVGDGDENHRRIIIQKYVIFYKIDNQDSYRKI